MTVTFDFNTNGNTLFIDFDYADTGLFGVGFVHLWAQDVETNEWFYVSNRYVSDAAQNEPYTYLYLDLDSNSNYLDYIGDGVGYDGLSVSDYDNYLTPNKTYNFSLWNYTGNGWGFIGEEIIEYTFENPIVYSYNTGKLVIGETTQNLNSDRYYAYDDAGELISPNNVYLDTSFGDGNLFSSYTYDQYHAALYFENPDNIQLNSDIDLQVKVLARDSYGNIGEILVDIDVLNEAPTFSIGNLPSTLELGNDYNFTMSTMDSIYDDFNLSTFVSWINVDNTLVNRTLSNQSFNYTLDGSNHILGAQVSFEIKDDDNAKSQRIYGPTIVDTTPITMIDSDSAANVVEPINLVPTDAEISNPVYSGITLLASDNDSYSLVSIEGEAQYITGLSNLSHPGLDNFIVLNSVSDTETQVLVDYTWLLDEGEYSARVNLADTSGNESFYDISFEVGNAAPEVFSTFVNPREHNQLPLALQVGVADGVFDELDYSFSITDLSTGELVRENIDLPELDGANSEETVIDLFGQAIDGYEDSEHPFRLASGLFDATDLNKGEYRVDFTATDSAGQSVSASKIFEINNDSLISDWNTRTVGDTLDITQDNISDSRWDRLIQTVMVYGTEDTDLSQIDSVYASDDTENIFDLEATRVIARDYDRDGNVDLRVYFSRSGLSDTIALDAEKVFVSGTDSSGENLFIAQNSSDDALTLV